MRGMALVVFASSTFEAPRGTYPVSGLVGACSSFGSERPDIQILSVATGCPGAGGLLQPFWQYEARRVAQSEQKLQVAGLPLVSLRR